MHELLPWSVRQRAPISKGGVDQYSNLLRTIGAIDADVAASVVPERQADLEGKLRDHEVVRDDFCIITVMRRRRVAGGALEWQPDGSDIKVHVSQRIAGIHIQRHGRVARRVDVEDGDVREAIRSADGG